MKINKKIKQKSYLNLNKENRISCGGNGRRSSKTLNNHTAVFENLKYKDNQI